MDISTLQNVHFESKSDLPECAAVYMVCRGAAVLYVGQSNNLKQRWGNHHRLQDFQGATLWLSQLGMVPTMDGLTIRWLPVENDDQRLQIEKELIQAYIPTLNWVESRESEISALKAKLAQYQMDAVKHDSREDVRALLAAYDDLIYAVVESTESGKGMDADIAAILRRHALKSLQITNPVAMVYSR
jgi:excinuclease UvrABC nuclease subunit